jgi:hypothetical protein
MHFLTARPVEDLAAAIDPRYELLVRLAAYTGLRAGELVALRVRLDFPPLAGHRGYAARVDGSGWSCRCWRSQSTGGR